MRFVHSALHPLSQHEPPLGQTFDPGLWSPTPPAQSSNPVIANLIDLAQSKYRAGHYAAAAAIARLIRERAPDEPEPQRMLALVAAWTRFNGPPHPWQTEYHVALGDAYRLLGDKTAAASHYKSALGIHADVVSAHIGLATLRMAGDFYYVWLERLYTALAPQTVIEIGVAEGVSLACVKPPAIAIGVDPVPKVLVPLKTETHIFAETSDAFFARRGPDALLAGRPLSIGFVDGLHLYEQALRDFINLERYCGPRSVILLHDTMPLDEATQNRARDTQFHTGDVWKVVLCLKHYRPDLDVFTIATPWTGLTVVAGLDADSRVLADRFDEAVSRFIDMPFSAIENDLESALNVVSNDWSVVEARLKARRIF